MIVKHNCMAPGNLQYLLCVKYGLQEERWRTRSCNSSNILGFLKGLVSQEISFGVLFFFLKIGGGDEFRDENGSG